MILVFLLFIQFYSAFSQDGRATYEGDAVIERLIEIAWENSIYHQAYPGDLDLAKTALKVAKLGWINGLSVGGNLNEFSISPPQDGNVFFPRYNIGVGFSVGQILGTKAEVAKSKNQLTRLDLQRKQDSLILRSEVRRRYKMYQTTETLLQMAEKHLIRTTSELELVEERFSEGSVDMVTYMEIIELHTTTEKSLVRAESEHALAKINVEEFLGIPLEEVFLAPSEGSNEPEER
ncbi:MAG: TolC family protein [Bacteroidota bacterium]